MNVPQLSRERSVTAAQPEWIYRPQIGFRTADRSKVRIGDKCGQSLPDLWVVAWRAIQDHARPFCTMKTGTARAFCETGHPTSGARQMRASGLSLVRQIRTNRRMRAYPSDLEPSVEQATPIEHWPL